MEPKPKGRENPVTSALNNERSGNPLDLLDEMVKVRQEAVETTIRLEAAVERIGKVAITDDYSPA